jgi:hypothetical protein
MAISTTLAIRQPNGFRASSTIWGRLIAAAAIHVLHIGGGLIAFPIKRFQFAKPSTQTSRRAFRN